MKNCRYFLPAVFLLFAGHANADRILIQGVTLIDGSGRPPAANTNVLIEGSRISAVTRAKMDRVDLRGTKRINGRGKYLIPGLMDVHIHLVGSIKVGKDGIREVKLDRDRGIRALKGYLYSGVTTVYDSGNIPGYIMGLREQERAGAIASPRIFAAGGIVTYPGSHGGGAGATLVDDWPEAIPLLEEHIQRRPDMLKVTLEERGWGARPMIPKLPLPLMEHIIEYYNDHGIRATAHTASELRARQAIFAGIDSLSHPVITGPISDDFARLMAVKQIPVATTLAIGENYSRLVEQPEFLDQELYRAVLTREEIAILKKETREEYRDRTWTWWMKLMTPVAQENLRRIHAAGGVIALGTDRSSGPAVHREMELLVAAGISPLDVIRIATLHGARFLGRAGDLGSITEGKLADMVLLDADPVADILNARRINTVIKNGRVVDRGALTVD